MSRSTSKIAYSEFEQDDLTLGEPTRRRVSSEGVPR